MAMELATPTAAADYTNGQEPMECSPHQDTLSWFGLYSNEPEDSRPQSPAGPATVEATEAANGCSHSKAFFERYDALLQEIESLSGAPAELRCAQEGHGAASARVAREAAKLHGAKRSVEHYELKLRRNRSSVFYRTPFQPTTWMRGGRKGRICRCEAKCEACLAEVSQCGEAFKSAQQACATQAGIAAECAAKESRRLQAEAQAAGMRDNVVGRNRSGELSRLESLGAAAHAQRDGDAAVLGSLRQMEGLVLQAQVHLQEAQRKELCAQQQNAQAERMAWQDGSRGFERMTQMSRDKAMNDAAQLAQIAGSLLQEAFSIVPAAVRQRYPDLAAGLGEAFLPGVCGQDVWRAGRMDDMAGGLGAALNDLGARADIEQNMGSISECQHAVWQQLQQIGALVGHYARDIAAAEQELASQAKRVAAESSRIFDEVRRQAEGASAD